MVHRYLAQVWFFFCFLQKNSWCWCNINRTINLSLCKDHQLKNDLFCSSPKFNLEIMKKIKFRLSYHHGIFSVDCFFINFDLSLDLKIVISWLMIFVKKTSPIYLQGFKFVKSLTADDGFVEPSSFYLEINKKIINFIS